LASFQAVVREQHEISIQRIDDQIIFEGQPLTGGMYPVRFASMLKHRNVGLLRITEDVTQQEMVQLAVSPGGRRKPICIRVKISGFASLNSATVRGKRLLAKKGARPTRLKY